MACTNCDNGCAEITSDKCVKYTGVDIPSLGINNGDSLCSVEQAITYFLGTALDGTGIHPAIDPSSLCTLISDNLIPATPNIVEIVDALIKAACSLQTQVNAVVGDVADINAAYTLGCLPPETDNEDVHAVVQAIIVKLCTLDDAMTALLASLPLTYVALADLNQLIQDYLNTIAQTSKMRNRMVPWAAQEYYGTLAGKFDATGAGIVGTDWEDIYICNGNNGTPDKRGRVAVGAIAGALGAALDPEVDPVTPTNPNYAAWDTGGHNVITLGIPNLPSHTHTAAGSTATQAAHFHYEFNTDLGSSHKVLASEYSHVQMDAGSNNFNYTIQGSNVAPTLGRTSSETPAITVNVVNDSTGGGVAHDNIQPVIACYYIMYIPHP